MPLCRCDDERQSVALPSAQASPPVLFDRRRVRRFPFFLPVREWSAGRRQGSARPLWRSLAIGPPRAWRSARTLGEGCCAFQRSIAALTNDFRHWLSSGAALSPGTFPRVVSQLLAGVRSTPGPSPEAARKQVYKTCPQGPPPTPSSRRLMTTPSVDGRCGI